MYSAPKRATSISTAIIALSLILGSICATVFILKKVFATSVTKANAQLIFDAFDATLKKGDAVIRDDKTAATIARDSFRKQTDSAPLDGWGHEMRVTATIANSSCTVFVRSAGADNAFDTADDVICEQSFDISKKRSATGLSATQIQE